MLLQHLPLPVLSLWAIGTLMDHVHASTITATPVIRGRAPPTLVPVTVEPQTTEAVVDISTMYYHADGVTTNSAVTTTIDGTGTIVPAWYCDPTVEAPVCKTCPTETAEGDAPCPTDFNMLILIPAAAIIGAWIPPPPGLPTLKIGDDGGATPTTPPEPEVTDQPPEEETTSHVPPPCTIASLQAKDLATNAPPKPTWVPPQGEPAPPIEHQLPVLQWVSDDGEPYLGSCGTSDDTSPGLFYQFGDEFSRDDGLWAINEFCKNVVNQKLVVGTKGQIHPSSPNPAVPIVETTWDAPGGVKIWTSVHVDLENRNPFGKTCPDSWMYSFYDGKSDSASIAECRQLMGQPIDYCDMEAALDDPKGKHGGYFFNHCIIFRTLKAPG